MDSIESARNALRVGDARAGMDILKNAADAGDATAAMELAFWNLRGQGLARDLVQARHYFQRAADLGDGNAKLITMALLANGTGGPADFPRSLQMLREAARAETANARQLELIEQMDLSTDGDPQHVPEARQLSEAPAAWLFPGLLTPDECAHLVEAAAPAFRPAHVGSVATGRQGYSDVRTCEVAGFPWIAEGPFVHAINRRIAKASGTRAEWGEPLQILRYAPGQEFKPHRDCTEASDNQRVLTMLVYLNEDYTGGETLFLHNGLRVRGATGDALLFRNADDQGRPDPASLHAGLPVETGVKLVASRWIRQKRFGPAA